MPRRPRADEWPSDYASLQRWNFQLTDDVHTLIAWDGMAFLHAVLAQTALPYRAPDNATEYIRRNGRASLIVQAGFLAAPPAAAQLGGGHRFRFGCSRPTSGSWKPAS
jgi:hypothetical protein